MTRRECPNCEGAGYGDVQEYDGGLREVTCDLCGGAGWIMETEHNAKGVMQSVPEPDADGHWSRTEAGGLYYQADDPALE